LVIYKLFPKGLYTTLHHTIAVKVKMETKSKPEEMLVWQKSTWGNCGQHSNIYTFVVDPDKLTMTPIFEALPQVRHVNEDSRKNVHRYTYAKVSDIISVCKGKVLKVVNDYASSSKRRISVSYYVVDKDITEIEAETGLRDAKGFYDVIKVLGKTLVIRKDSVEVKSE